MNIGIDIDDTINNLAEILCKAGTRYNKLNNIKFDIKKDKWHFDEAFGWDKQTATDFLKKNLEKLCDKAEAKENVANIINKLKSEGHKILIITARSTKNFENPYDLSKNWLEKNNIYFDKLIVNSKDKWEECINEKIDLFIDDYIENCEGISKNTETKILLFDSPYNKEEKRFKRVYTWNEIYKKIHEEIA